MELHALDADIACSAVINYLKINIIKLTFINLFKYILFLIFLIIKSALLTNILY
jgi:hypothetical protein